ncbi:MAG: amidase [Pseudomonadota bacterium]|nr:amidase [Pseudomonadota bacterium]
MSGASDALHYKTAVELAAMIRSKQISCRELLEHFLARCDSHNAGLNAIVVWKREEARERAIAADDAIAKGVRVGPLHGVPMTIKESYDWIGTPTTWGVPELKDNIAQTNSVVVDRMLAAGVNLFGKTNVPLLLGDWETFNEIYGTTNNPWDVSRIPGGSSGGSAAALAAGLTALEAGSDIGASIRNPAHYCGVYGHKPTWGLVPLRGQAMPGVLSHADISVVGPLARGAEDLAVALEAMAGPDLLEADGYKLDLVKPVKRNLSEFRIAVMTSDENCPVDSEYADRIQAVAEACAKAGATVSDTARPEIDLAKSHDIYIRLLRGVTTARLPSEVFERNREAVTALPDDDESYVARNLRASVQYHRDWIASNEERTYMRWAWHAFFQQWDVLLCPTASSAAFPHAQKGERWDRMISVNGEPQSAVDQLFWAGMSGVVLLPSTVAPAGLTRSGLPTGVQIVGGSMQDLRTIDFARLLADEVGSFEPPMGYD